MAGEIVVGYDGTDGAKAALDCAIGLAKDIGAPLVLVFSYEPTLVGGEIQDHRAALKEIGKRVTGEGAERARAAGVEAEAVLVEERPADGLVRVAAERRARMIAVGSHGEGPLKGAVLGSVPHKLVQLSETPVLVVRRS